MRITYFLLAALFLGATNNSFAQVLEPIAETPLELNAKKIFTNTTTGIPVLQTVADYIGMSPKDGSILWTVPRNAGAALTEMADSESSNVDFDEIPNTPLVFASGNLINVINGELIINGEENDLRRLRSYYVLPDQDLILMEIAGKGAIYLYAVDPFENVQKWGVQLREASGLSMSISEGNSTFSTEELKPQLNAAGNLIYDNGKYLALIDMKTGELKWNEKINAGYIFTNKKGDRMVIAEARGAGLGSMMASVPGAGGTTGGGSKKFGKKLHLIDTETGQSIWKKEKKLDGNVLYVSPYEEGFMVVHDEGMNIYSFDDPKGDGRWKKDYSEKGVSNVESVDEGLMVYFKSKRMLIDPVSGDEKWKKAEKLEKEPKGFLWGLVDVTPDVRQIGQHEVTFNNSYITVGRGKRYSYTWILEEEDRVVVVIPEPTEGNRIGKPRFIATAIELGGETVTSKKINFGIKKGLAAFDKTDGGYFFYNDRGYVLMKYVTGDGFVEIKDEWYPDPTATLRTLTAIATAAGSMTYAGAQTANMVTSPASSGSVSSYQNRMSAMNEASDASFDFATNRKINGRIDDNFAFFFARDGKEGATLFKVDKNTGEEVNKFRFDDLTPLYEIDYVNGRLYYQANNTFKIFLLE